MILVWALMGGSLVIGWLGPMLLRWLTLRVFAPPVHLVAWLMLVTGWLATVAVAVVLAALPGHGPAPELLGLLHSGWRSLRHGAANGIEDIAAGAFLVLLAGVAVRVMIGLVRQRQAAGRCSQRHRELLAIVSRRDEGPIPHALDTACRAARL